MYTFKTYLLLEDIESKLPILVKQFGKIVTNTSNFPGGAQGMRSRIAPVAAEDAIQYIAKRADPTYPTAKYITWILQMIKGGSIRGEEDYDKTKSRLVQFERLKRIPNYIGSRDINQYKTYGELAHAINANLSVKSKGEQIRTAEMAGVDWIAEQGDWTMYLVNTPEAASKLFRETDWCIKDPKWFNQYKDKNFYYITGISKGPRHTSKVPDIELPLYLANFGTKQLKDKNDNAIDEYGQQEYTTIGKYDVYTNPKVVHLLLDFFRPLPAYQAFKKDCIKRNTKSLAGGNYVPAEVEEWCEATFKKILWTEDIGDLLGPGAQVGVPLLKKVDKRQIGILIESIFSMMEDWASDKEFLEPPNEFYALLIKDGADALPEEVRSGANYDARIIWIENKRKDQAWLKVKAKEIADWASENLYWTYSS